MENMEQFQTFKNMLEKDCEKDRFGNHRRRTIAYIMEVLAIMLYLTGSNVLWGDGNDNQFIVITGFYFLVRSVMDLHFGNELKYKEGDKQKYIYELLTYTPVNTRKIYLNYVKRITIQVLIRVTLMTSIVLGAWYVRKVINVTDLFCAWIPYIFSYGETIWNAYPTIGKGAEIKIKWNIGFWIMAAVVGIFCVAAVLARPLRVTINEMTFNNDPHVMKLLMEAKDEEMHLEQFGGKLPSDNPRDYMVFSQKCGMSFDSNILTLEELTITPSDRNEDLAKCVVYTAKKTWKPNDKEKCYGGTNVIEVIYTGDCKSKEDIKLQMKRLTRRSCVIVDYKVKYLGTMNTSAGYEEGTTVSTTLTDQ